MPWSPPTPCTYPGCGEICHGPRCERHKREARRESDDRRGTAARRGYNARHRRWRKMVLARCPICRMCGKAPATVADHIIPLKQGGGWSLLNGQGLCASCHGRKTAIEDGGFGRS